jgi:hypothetical protein
MAGLFMLCFVYFLPRPGDWNQDSRLDTDLAIVNHGSLQVDRYRWNAPGDIVPYQGHWYPSKAPGQALLGIPVFAAYKGALTLAGHRADAEQLGLKTQFHRLYAQFYIAQFLESMYTVTIPAVAFLLLFFWFLGYFSDSFLNRTILTLALGLSTGYFAYAQVFYPHVSTAAVLFGAFMLLYVAGRGARGEPARAPRLEGNPALATFLAGLCLGAAGLLDHTAAAPGAVIAAYALFRVPPKLWLFVALGALPGLLITAGYNYAAYHNIGVTGYSTGDSGVGGSPIGGAIAGQPNYGSPLWGMSFSPFRGIFFLSPFLLLAFPGMALWRRRGIEWLVCLAASMVLFLVVSSIYFWYGGSAMGPRYLIQMLPFLALPVIFVLDRAKSLPGRLGVYALILISTLNVWLQTIAAKGYPSPKLSDPLFQWAIPNVERGNVALSLGSVLLAPFVGIYSKWTLLPLLIVILLWTWYCFRSVIKVAALRLSDRRTGSVSRAKEAR